MNKHQVLASIAVASLCSGILVLLTDIEKDLTDLLRCKQLSTQLEPSKRKCF